MTATYKTMPNLIAQRIPFTHGSHHATLDGDLYTVISYSTIIAIANGDNLWLNPTKYSMTTSRLQNLIKRAWGLN